MRRTPGDFLYDLFLVRQRIKDWLALPHFSEGQNPTILLSHKRGIYVAIEPHANPGGYVP